MPVLDADTLDSIRSSVSEILADIYPDTMSIQRGETYDRDVDNPDSYTTNPNIIASDVGCKYKELHADERFTYQRVDTVADYEIKFSAEYEIRNGDILIIDEKGFTPSFQIQVTGCKIGSNNVFQKVTGKRMEV